MTGRDDIPVLVLHGLGMNRIFMAGFTQYLRKQGHKASSISYPSRHKSFAQIVEDHVVPAIEALDAPKVDFVGHSMGGLLVRLYAHKHGNGKIGRGVMAGTPNHGSQVADFVKNWTAFRSFCGDVGQTLGTGPEDIHADLPDKVDFECGVIAGENKYLHFPTSYIAGIPVPNDGIVSVESTKINGMTDHTVVIADHSQMVWSPTVWKLAAQFLAKGKFED